ncbi:MAG TPA: YciI family protein [Rhodocyclaceae bacterium]|nr:YciI family protein [Rhodocyclaceae bacterium]
MLYVFIGDDAPEALATRLSVRAEHLARLRTLQELGRLVLAGPLPALDCDDPGPAGFMGSLVIAEFESLQAAEAWFADDPYVRHGVFADYRVRPFRQVLPA